MLKLLPIGLAAVLLAGCSSVATQDGARVAATASASTSASPAATVSTAPATCGIDTPCGSGGAPHPPAPTPDPIAVPDACTLITRADLVSVTIGDHVDLLFTGDPIDEPPHPEAATGRGVTSFCRHVLRSHFVENYRGATQVSTSDGQVDVRIQTEGADLYFPARGGDTAVAGLGDEAMLRYTTLYVRSGRDVLTVQVGISAPSQGNIQVVYDQQIAWAKELAAIALPRLQTRDLPGR
jgi:uncharacterized protein YceK